MAKKTYSAEEKSAMVEQVLEGMAEGATLAETVKKIQKARKEIPGQGGISAGQIRQWIADDEALYKRYQRMKGLLGQAFAEEAIRVAKDSMVSTTALDRVLIDTLKWAAAKANPGEYGEKQTVQHEGAPTLQVKIVEDDLPVRNPKAVGNAVAAAIVSTPTLTLNAGISQSDDESAADYEVIPEAPRKRGKRGISAE